MEVLEYNFIKYTEDLFLDLRLYILLVVFCLVWSKVVFSFQISYVIKYWSTFIQGTL